MTYHADQSFSAKTEGIDSQQGCWWVDGNNYCHDPGAEHCDRQCFQVLQDGNELRWFDLDGYAALTFHYDQP